MSRAGKPFIPLVPSSPTRPKSAFSSPYLRLNIIRDQFTLATWLSLGAAVQGLAYALLGRISLLPVGLWLGYSAFTTYAMSVGWMQNRYLDGVLMKKFSAQYPDEVGQFDSKPASKDIVVLHLGVRFNHPLGILGPNAKEIAGFFTVMTKDLEANPEEYGFMGATQWISTGDRESKNEMLSVIYFKTIEGLHKFAHAKEHRAGWDWWNANVTSTISINHEVFHAPAGHWENIFVNNKPSHFATTTHKIFDQESGREMWASPIVDASKGLLKTSAGRMARSEKAAEHEKAGVVDPYDV